MSRHCRPLGRGARDSLLSGRDSRRARRSPVRLERVTWLDVRPADPAVEVIARCGLRPTYTPTVMLTRWRLNMADLPSYDRARAFRLLVALFAIADTRRRERYCVGGCSHEWHQPAASEDAGPAPT
ncbi:DUF5958 family protein [Streptomyces mirabilis]|uniref:DUF5958 family protein n=2 Tax=Streptomyces TaxID=1883 RepID=UPI003F4E10F8